MQTESFLQHMFKVEALGLDRLPFTSLCLAATSFDALQPAENTLQTLVDEALKYSGDKVTMLVSIHLFADRACESGKGGKSVLIVFIGFA